MKDLLYTWFKDTDLIRFICIQSSSSSFFFFFFFGHLNVLKDLEEENSFSFSKSAQWIIISNLCNCCSFMKIYDSNDVTSLLLLLFLAMNIYTFDIDPSSDTFVLIQHGFL